MPVCRILLYQLCLLAVTTQGSAAEVNWFDVDELPPLPIEHGISGAFVGNVDDTLIVAGGSNFPVSKWAGGTKVFHQDVYVLRSTANGDPKWMLAGQIPRPVAHGAAVTTNNGLLCLGGCDTDGLHNTAFLLNYDPTSKKIHTRATPSLPVRCSYLTAARLGDTVYVAGGRGPDGALHSFWSMTLPMSQAGWDDVRWQRLEPWPGPARFGAVLVTQSNGQRDCLYLFSGKSGDEYLTDGYRFDAKVNAWSATASMPRAAMAAPAAAVGQTHVVLFSGSDGHDVDRLPELKDDYHFVRDILAYHTITDTWITAGQLPLGVVGTAAVAFDNGYVLPGGEIGPGRRTATVQQVKLHPTQRHFGGLDLGVLVVYLLSLVAVGIYFARGEQTTGKFFLGGQQIPFWAAGLSLLATQVSSIGFMAIPAKAYATNWVYFTGVLMWFVAVPVVIWAFIPFYRRLNVTSAYEYLESRFNVGVRLYAAVAYSLLQLGRMAVVVYLPALALSAVTGMDQTACIITMGVLCTIYTVAGGIEAVIWTDVIQAAVLIGGALVCVIVVILDTPGGLSQFFHVAMADHKFHLANLDWSMTAPTLWVILVGNAFIRLSTLTSDQAVVQRYMTTKSERLAARALWTDVLASLPWAVIVFTFGTALYVFYKSRPELLSPAVDTDGIVPLFVAQQLPAGLSGVIVAAIFAAAMSSLDSSMHSVATVWITDFYARFWPETPDRKRLTAARWITVLLGFFGTGAALLIGWADIESQWDLFWKVLGLFVGPLTGLFLLGIFTRRAHGTGTLIGAIAGALVMWQVQARGLVHFFLYTAVGIGACFLVGYLASMVLPGESHTRGLTIYRCDREKDPCGT